jgi:hypothetical protein
MRARGAVLADPDVPTVLEYLTRTHGPSANVDEWAGLTAAVKKSATVGYMWTGDVTGYAIKYAHRVTLPGGAVRIIIATDQRLGSQDEAVEALPAPTTNYLFSVVDLKLDPKGVGEGRTSLNTKVVVDSDAKTIALDNNATTPAILKNVKR